MKVGAGPEIVKGEFVGVRMAGMHSGETECLNSFNKDRACVWKHGAFLLPIHTIDKMEWQQPV